MKIAVLGSINIDQTVLTEQIPKKGETLPGHDLCYIPGGKGANQAVAMARLGAEVTMFGCVGADENGRKMTDNLRKNHVNTDPVRRIEDLPTGIAIITVGEKDNTIVVVPGANQRTDCAYVESICGELLSFDMVVLQHEIPLDAVHKAVGYCSRHGIPTILNPAPAAPVPPEILEKVTFLTPNEHEARLIFGEGTPFEAMLRRYPGKLIITQGSRGVSFCLPSGEIRTIPARASRVLDTTGAGDTLNGAFAFRIASGDSLEESLKYANTAAGLSTEKQGAQGGMPTAAEVEAAL